MLSISLGASACVQLNQFEEAIEWCDKGLAVSFENFTLYMVNTTQLSFVPFYIQTALRMKQERQHRSIAII